MRILVLRVLSLALALPMLACGGAADNPCDRSGVLCAWAGTGAPGFDGDGHSLAQSRLYWPIDVTFTKSGATYIVDWNNHRVRRLQPDGTLLTVVGTDFVGDGAPGQADLTPAGAPGTTVVLNHPTQLLEMPGSETLLLVSWHNHKLRTFDPATGIVKVACGRGAGPAMDGPIETALLNQPAATAFGSDGMLYVLDQRNQRIRRITSLAPGGMITTVAGSGMPGFEGDGGPPLLAKLSFPPGSNPPPAGSLTFGLDGKLYFSDTLNNRVRRVDFQANLIETVVGDGTPAALNNPRDLAVAADGRLFIADEKNHRVLSFDPATRAVAVVAGTGVAGNTGDGDPATLATLNSPTGLAIDGQGFLYIADTLNSRIRRVRIGGAK